MHASRLLAPTLILAVGLMGRPATAFPVNSGNSYVPAPSHGLLLAVPSMGLDGQSMGGWGYLDLGVAERLSVTVDSLYLNLAGVSHDFGTTFVGLGIASQPAPWLTLRLSPLLGIRSGQFGQSQLALRAYGDFRLGHDLTLYTMPAYYQPMDGSAVGSFRFNATLEQRLTLAVSTALEVLSGTPAWEFGPDTRLALAPSVTVLIGAYSLQASLRTPLVAASSAAGLAGPEGVVCLGYGW